VPTWSVVLELLSYLLLFLCCLLRAPQGICAKCHESFTPDRPSRLLCGSCRKKPSSNENNGPTIQERVTNNAARLFRLLPSHSHHRAPLLAALSQNLTSAEAAQLFPVSPSYVRTCKRKDHSESDFFTEKYAKGAKHPRLQVDQIWQVFNFILGACPPKSGCPYLRFKQYVNDDELYDWYRKSLPAGHNDA
jgi:hypothetical protein